jgi:hypothetical protein
VRLNQTNLQATLATLFGLDPRYVVPLQGNVFNPQAGEANPARPRTWCGFRIDGERNVTAAHYVPNGAPAKNWSVVHKTATISLQFVGDMAEDLSNSVAHWTHNQRAQDGFAAYDGRVFADSGEVTVTDFEQQGVNTVLAYNVRVRVIWADEIDSLQVRPMEPVKFTTPAITV